jgi:type I restriction enzyme S subunit
MKYQAYPEYKDSEVERIGKHPLNWNLTRVKFESYVKARVGWHGLKSDDFIDEGPYLVTGSDFRGPNIKWDDCYHCDLARYEQDPYIQLLEGDLLITKDGTIGKVALVSNLDGQATLNSGVFVVRPLTDNYSSQFYFWLLQASIFTGFVDFNKTGSTIVHLYQDTFVNFMFAMPSFNEQLAIANFLDHETAKIDTLIEKQQQLIKLLKEKRQAVISHAVTKGLNPNAPMRDSGVEWLGVVPEHWVVMQLRRITHLQQGLQIPQENRFSEEGENRVEYITIKSINSGADRVHKEFIYSPSVRVVCDKNDVLLARTGATGEVVTNVSGAFHNNFFKINYDENKIERDYLVYFFKVNEVKNHLLMLAGTTTIPDLNHGAFLGTLICLPNKNEQHQICKYLDEELKQYNYMCNQTHKFVELLKERRTALVSAAVTGKIDVRNWQAPEPLHNNNEISKEETA